MEDKSVEVIYQLLMQYPNHTIHELYKVISRKSKYKWISFESLQGVWNSDRHQKRVAKKDWKNRQDVYQLLKNNEANVETICMRLGLKSTTVNRFINEYINYHGLPTNYASPEDEQQNYTFSSMKRELEYLIHNEMFNFHFLKMFTHIKHQAYRCDAQQEVITFFNKYRELYKKVKNKRCQLNAASQTITIKNNVA